ncbi:nucleoside 2-deoxyribosyltransferase [Citrobacter koseri]|uniref:nucleoside 2-deoxyribosyltransferase n=1 Tax=Citrobacter koseri TaxID=545 RepID=UPI0010702D42|nr:nucleoside 2-deoxyribosyltransferase [Citrobacter koseri]MBJ8875952.1 nucleoside 2-deoxyribosyltransferase [Citrobacter koseri]MBJ9235433.1 nucleoside 2-deoxyribosyltransferase [Citrobacter koseri]VFS12389.1 Nucleoside 2-deoxyribosyltransferase [Citrobacter koseri]
MKNKRTIYLAAPLFNEAELSYNQALKECLEPAFNVFLPQEDGLLLRDIVTDNIPPNIAEKKVFEADIMAMNNADIILVVLNGAHIDEGVAFELGYCFAIGKRCIGLKEDIRQALPTGNNPMISQSCERIFDNKNSLLSWIMP